MRTLTEKIVPNTTLAFTVLILVSGITSIINGGGERILFLNLFILLLTFFALCCMEYLILARIDFRTAAGYYLISFGMWYLFMGIGLFATGWMGFCLENLLQYTVWTVILYILLTRYNIRRIRREADEINQLLNDQR